MPALVLPDGGVGEGESGESEDTDLTSTLPDTLHQHLVTPHYSAQFAEGEEQ